MAGIEHLNNNLEHYIESMVDGKFVFEIIFDFYVISIRLFIMILLKLINNLSSLNKGNYYRDGVWISDINQRRFLRFYFSFFSIVLVLIEKIYHTLKTVFDHISKHLEVRPKDSAARRIFNSLLGVWKCGQIRS